MNIREYVDNPMGKGDSSIPNRKQLVDSLNIKYEELIRKKGNKIKMTTYKDKLRDVYYFHLVIPSESDRNNSYDVVFRFSDESKKYHKELSISNYDVSVFSNSPSFAYTFAYVYAKHGLFIEWLSKKLGEEFITKEPEIRNRFGIINYEKYVYFGARYILDSKRLNRALLDMSARVYTRLVLGKEIRNLTTIMKEYHNADAELRRKKKKQKAKGESSGRPSGRSKSVQSKASKSVSVKTSREKIQPKKKVIKTIKKK